MAGPRGYSSYRGRTPKGKIALAVVLVLIILAAVGFILLQENIFYDETGSPRLNLPWQTTDGQPTEDGEEDLQEELDITVQEAKEDIYAFTAASPLTQSGWEEAWTSAPPMSAPPYNAVAVTMKGEDGRIYYDSDVAVSGTVETAEDTAAALAEMTGMSYHTIARLSCFLDPLAAKADVEGMGLKNTGGFIFYDGDNLNWLDPSKPAARKYLCDMAAELAGMGFDEILLTNVSYPTVGKIDKIDYNGADRAQSLRLFLEEMRAALAEYDITLSVELPEDVIAAGQDSVAGQVLTEIAPLVDRIYAVTGVERLPSLEAAVTAANASTDFVPELEAYTSDFAGENGCLILPDD